MASALATRIAGHATVVCGSRLFGSGFVFMAVFVFPLLSLPWLACQRSSGRSLNAAFAASTVLSLPDAHYVFSSADVPHLSFGVFPMLLACLVVLRGLPPKLKWSLLAGGCVKCRFDVSPASRWEMPIGPSVRIDRGGQRHHLFSRKKSKRSGVVEDTSC